MNTMKDFFNRKSFQDLLSDEIERIVHPNGEIGMKKLWETTPRDCRIYYMIDEGIFSFHIFMNCKGYYSSLEAYYADNNHIYCDWDTTIARKLEFMDEKNTRYELRIFKEYRNHEIAISHKVGNGSVKRQLINLVGYTS